MNWIDDLFSYLDESDPDFRSRVRGASVDEIRQLECAMGVPLPQVHLEYLRAMGLNDGGLFESDRARTDVSTLLMLIEDIREQNPSVDFARFIPIALGDVYEGWALLKNGIELPVVLIDHSQPDGYVAGNLPKLAFQTAFSLRTKAIAHQISVRVPYDDLQLTRLSERVAELGFSPEWFCDRTEYFGSRYDVFLQMRVLPDWGIMVWVTAQDVETAKQVAEVLAKSFGGILKFKR